MKKRNKSLKNILIIIISIIIFILIIALLITSFFNFNLDKYYNKVTNKETTFIDIPDECSLILGNVIHQIRDEGECRIHCNNNCRLEELKMNDVKFTKGNNSCHKCECYCL